MARYQKGILGTFINRVGTVVGRKWRNRQVMASYQPIVRNPRTEAQTAHRKRFVAIVLTAKGLLNVLNVSAKNIVAGTQWVPRTWFSKMNFVNTTVDGSGVVNVNYSALKIAQGPVPRVFDQGSLTFNAGVLTVPFDGNLDAAGAVGSDSVYLGVYTSDLNQSVLSAPARRSAGEVTVQLPSAWTGLTVHVFIFAAAAADRAEYGIASGDTSDSNYVGTGEVE